MFEIEKKDAKMIIDKLSALDKVLEAQQAWQYSFEYRYSFIIYLFLNQIVCISKILLIQIKSYKLTVFQIYAVWRF
jgi:hypothetical protein